jgi:hypothetical protein
MNQVALAGRPDGWCVAQTRLDLAAFSSGGVGSRLSPIGTPGTWTPTTEQAVSGSSSFQPFNQNHDLR